MHEAPRQDDTPKLGSNRSFGLVFAGVFAIITAYIFIRHGRFSIPAAAVSAVFLLCALLVPQILTSLNKLWFRFGLLLHKVVSPVVLGGIFYVILTPAGFLLRLFSKKDEKTAQWVERSADDLKAGSFRNQF